VTLRNAFVRCISVVRCPVLTYQLFLGISVVGETSAVAFMENNTTMNSRSVKKWQVFPGRNNFCCDGRVMMGASPWIFYFTCVLIIVTNGLFFGVEYVLIFICAVFVDG